LVEVGIISLQAWRGTTSHFNVGTPLDGVLFTVMGAAILMQTLSSVVVLVALWRQQHDDPTMGWALRFGLLITILGAFSGGLMSRPTDAQLLEAETTGRLTLAGAHTVGAPDGGPGLPGTGWSTTHGDLRVAHFAGLHAMQLLPLLGVLVARVRQTVVARTRSVLVAAGSYAALFAGLLWQALRGQSFATPDETTLVAGAAWVSATALAWWWAGRTAQVALVPHVVSGGGR
jgi:hypothetical protein